MDYWEKPTTHGRKTQKSDLDAYTKKQEFIFYIQEIGYFKAPILTILNEHIYLLTW